jgi:RNA polymerase subunit RPABC4/transcription elongation factor Spt4
MTPNNRWYRSSSSESWQEKKRLIRFRRRKEHLRFSEEIKLVPRILIHIMIAILAVAEDVTLTLCYKNIPDGQPWPPVEALGRNTGMIAVAGIVLAAWIPLAIIVFLIGYVFVDARRRDMNAGMWVFLILIMLPAWVGIGFILYFFAREPLPYHCPRCGTMVTARFNYCPACKYCLHPVCGHCQREVGEMDKFCPHCGSDLATPAGVPVSSPPLTG